METHAVRFGHEKSTMQMHSALVQKVVPVLDFISLVFFKQEIFTGF